MTNWKRKKTKEIVKNTHTQKLSLVESKLWDIFLLFIYQMFV